jgi:uncharacterized protein (TIGR02217 family)
MHNFHDILLPDFIAIHLKGGPNFATSIASSMSGREIRISDREYSIQRYNLSGARLSFEQFNIFNCFFRNRKGKNYSFRAKDYADFQLNNQMLRNQGATTRHVEIFKIYEDNIGGYFRRITTLCPSTIMLNIAVQDIDYINGIITLNRPLAPEENLIINAEFDVAVRFCSDEFKYSFCQDGSVLIDELELQEVII